MSDKVNMDLTGLEINRRIDKAKLLKGNSCSLRRYKSTNYHEIVSVVDELYDEMVQVCDLNLSRKSSSDKLKYHIEFFILNLYKTYCNDPARVISYSRNRSTYSDKKSMYKRKFGLSFRYSVEAGMGVINFLEKKGYIETFSFMHNKARGGSSYQSRMRATPKFIELIEDKYEVTAAMLELDRSKDETVIVKGLKPKDVWIMEPNEYGRMARKKKKRKRKICKTPDTPLVREMRKNLKVINDVMDKAEITLDISEEELKVLNARMLDELDPYKQAIDFSRKHVYRVFLDRRLDRGGRFFGPWYQNIPKEYRPRIMINGAPTLELDYSSLHPYLLYFIAKKKPPKDGLYNLDGYSNDTRKFRKALFLRMINCESRLEAKGAVRRDAFEKNKLVVPAQFGKLQDKDLDPLIDAYLKKHKQLEDYIFKVKGIGNVLQYIDSQIAEHILLYFAKQGIPVLPIHDSFRVDARLYQKLEEIMRQVISQNFGSYIPITNDDLEPLMTRIQDILTERLAEGDEELERNLTADVIEMSSRLDKLKTMKVSVKN